MSDVHDSDSRWSAEAARSYASKYGDWPTTRLPIEALQWRPNEAVIDIGCGTGASLRHLLGYVPRGRLIGVEPNPTMLAIAQDQTEHAGDAEHIKFHRAAAEHLPFDRASIDTALVLSSFHHWQNQEQGLTEVLRVLKPSGRLVLCEEPEVMALHGMTAEGIKQQLHTAGFIEMELHVLGTDANVYEMVLARKAPVLNVSET